MSTTAAALGPDAGDELIFQWERRAYSRWRLAMMLLLSLLAHAASFYILQVAYTPSGSLLPPPAQVVFVAPDAAESVALSHWIDLADPSLMTQPRPLSAEQLLKMIGFHYVPSYATLLQTFKPLPAQAPAGVPPRTRKPGPVPAGLLPPVGATGEPPGASNAAAPGASPTRVVLSGGIEALVSDSLPPVPPPEVRAVQPLERTVFLVGIPAGGGSAWIFAQTSSGDATDKGADAAARAYLARLRFHPPASHGSNRPAWGWATFDWGRDAYPP